MSRFPKSRARRGARASLSFAALLALAAAAAPSYAQTAGAPVPLAQLDLAGYVGTWHQVAHIPNSFQKQCVADTTATYRRRPDGRVEVTNRCRTASGAYDDVVGVAEPRRPATLSGDILAPASLRVTFVPTWLRWLPPVWGDYDVLHLSDDRRLAIVGEPSRQYLWVLSREPQLSDAAWADVQRRVRDFGYDPSKVERDAGR